jgi:hypothetical protein
MAADGREVGSPALSAAKAETVEADELYWGGSWDETLAASDRLIANAVARSGDLLEALDRVRRAKCLVARGQLAKASADVLRLLELSKNETSPQMLLPGPSVSARVLLEVGSSAEASALTEKIFGAWRARAWLVDSWIVDLAIVLVGINRGARLLPLAKEASP